MRARQNRDPDRVNVFLQSRRRNHFRRLSESRVNDLHSRVAQRAGNNFRAPVVSV
jgi:hypothetical protein